jgi:hypothetical protein
VMGKEDVAAPGALSANPAAPYVLAVASPPRDALVARGVSEAQQQVAMAGLRRAEGRASKRYNRRCRSMGYVYDYHIFCASPGDWLCSTLLMAVTKPAENTV